MVSEISAPLVSSADDQAEESCSLGNSISGNASCCPSDRVCCGVSGGFRGGVCNVCSLIALGASGERKISVSVRLSPGPCTEYGFIGWSSLVNSAFDRTARLLRQMIRPIRPSTSTMITAARAHLVITVGPLALTLKSPLELCKTIVALLDDVPSLLPLCMDGKLT